MPATRRKLAQLSLGISALVFFTGGIYSLTDGTVEYGVFQLLAGAVNLIQLSSWPDSGEQRAMVAFTFILNVIIALTVAWDYYQQGTRFLHFAWVLAAVFSLVGMLVFLFRGGSRPSSDYGLRKE